MTTGDQRRPAVRDQFLSARSSPVRDLLDSISDEGLISLAGGLPAADLFDLEGIRDSFHRVLSSSRARSALQYSGTQGDPLLRQLLADRLTDGGPPTSPADLIITSGSQQALSLLSTVLVSPGDVIVTERPTYLAALQCFSQSGARIRAVDGDADGLETDSLEATLSEGDVRAIYVVPNFANPTGTTLARDRRQRLLDLAIRFGCWIIEDDPYGELRYEGDPIPPVAALDGGADQVAYLGTFSKVGVPGLRVGWVRLPSGMRSSMIVAKQAADLHTPTLTQTVLADYLATADLDAHIRQLVVAYRLRRDAMLDALREHLPPGSNWTRAAGGMFVWVRLPSGLDASAMLPDALRAGVAYVPGEHFYPAEEPGPVNRATVKNTMRLAFPTEEPRVIAEGVDRLGRVIAEAQ